MDWTKIVWAILLAGMLIYLLPHAKRMMKESPKGSSSDWMSFILPMGAVILFVILLIALV